MGSLVKCKGLHTNHNELAVPEGALEQADNVNIDQNDTLTPRNGFKSYGDDFPLTSERAKQLATYKDRIIRHYGNSLQFDSDGSGTFSTFAGTYSELESGLRIKYKESNGNFYFTTSDGIKKISASSSSTFSTSANFIKDSGVAKGLDVQSTLDYTAGGFLTADNQIAYRVVWGYTDTNNNLLLGSPSDRTTITNSEGISITAFVDGGGGQVTVTSANHNLEENDEVTIIGTTNYNGTFTATNVTTNTFEITDTWVSDDATGTWSYICQCSLTFTIPYSVNTTDYFYQVYRTGLSGSDSTDPGDEMNLVFEEQINDTDISNGFVTVVDENYPETFRVASAPLYTNEESGDGILQSNDRPPVAKDIASFKESLFFANTKTLHKRTITLLAAATLVAGTTKFIIANSDHTSIYNGETTETAASLNFQIYTTGSVSQNIRNTALSLIHVINRDPNRIVNAYYSSGSEDLPGQISFESITLSDNHIDFSVVGNVGSSFNPTLSETSSISGISTDTLPIVTTATNHGYATGNTVYLYCPTSTPVLNDSYEIIVTSTTTFTITETITGAGTSGYSFKQLIYTDNQEVPNRLYFSKTGQPEAVPTLNYLDIGARDSEIVRIIALRDNLFVLKDDSLYTISGTSAPNFSATLMESSFVFNAADTAVEVNNQIFALTSQGVVKISGTGVGVISRQIEDKILGVANTRYSYLTTSFGLGYESDRAYHLWLPTETSDTSATQCFRYNFFNNAWTRWTKSATCGIVNDDDDKMYLGDPDNDFIVRERKNDARSDFADLEYSTTITLGGMSGTSIVLTSISNIDVGDALYQEQWVTVGRFNRLLKKLDLDIGVENDYFSTLELNTGDNPYTYMENLMIKLTADDSGQTYTYDSPSSFEALKTTFNGVITKLNEAASDSFYVNYIPIDGSVFYDVVVLSKVLAKNTVTISIAFPFLEGGLTIFKAYTKIIEWSPQHFGDASIWKQVRDGTIFFDGNTFTNAEIGFATDFSPSFDMISFNGLGIGAFGSSIYGDTIFGGEGTDKPFHTTLPRQKQRCRYISTIFIHRNAREGFKIVGISYSMRSFSSRAYKSL